MSDDVDATGEALSDSLAAVRDREPLVQQLTNEVTKNDLANVTLGWGAIPVMADAPGEAPEMAELADAVLLNTGRMTDSNVEALHAAGKRANELGVPVVLDPVGAGTTPTREEVHASLLEKVEFAAIKGNYGEVTHLAGADADVKGVESIGEYEEIAESALALAETTGAAVVASGAEDIVAGPDRVYRVSAGHEMLTTIIGTGCMLGSTLAAFAGSLEDDLAAAVHGTLAYGLAGERATDLEYNGPASYRVNFLDSIAGLTPDVATGLETMDRLERLH
ncbi:hydroxyethylthiazole kinase [Natronolimnohabitans innermongolicus]|uniref:Hydroxyethylthiazole kinase n=1 Tax=Natronolimnohabitans innermongolicus JCM 12255 TaxID=1227499 RepID=L9WL91_9EURY|nr:hydroxyethylthiazole kinase [Natronolimnohabitans innermongolicus]ELY50142.1 hydroxyethylthiazole kinase [Natronolimnohabitans innermongolicus JCM 12255]